MTVWVMHWQQDGREVTMRVCDHHARLIATRIPSACGHGGEEGTCEYCEDEEIR